MAAQRPHPLTTLLKKALFRLASGAFIVVQIGLLAFLVWTISEIIPDPNYFLLGTLLILFFAGPFLIGAFSYFVFQRMTREEYLGTEAERWLAERQAAKQKGIKRRKSLRRWALWIPSVSVLFFCLFLDETWPPVSRLFHPSAGNLLGYKVPIPLNWAVVMNEPDAGGEHTWSYVRAIRGRGMLRNSIDLFIGRKPSIAMSSITFYGASPKDEFAGLSLAPYNNKPITTRTYSLGSLTLTCEEFHARDRWIAEESRIIQCLTPKRDFSGEFEANGEDDPKDFLEIVRAIKKVQ